MARKRARLPKDFSGMLEKADLPQLVKVFDKCALDARGGYHDQTALGFADCPDELAQWLVAQGLDINLPSPKWGRTPLHERVGKIGSIEKLLDLGADPNLADDDGERPLHAAAIDSPKDVRLLLARGADATARANDGRTALEFALAHCRNTDIPGVAESARLLLEAGCPVPADIVELVTDIGVEFEFHRSAFNPDSVDEVDAGLTSLYLTFDVAPVPRRDQHDGITRITVSALDTNSQFTELWNLLVPSMGSASCLQGEVVRAVGRITREVRGNGGANWDKEYRKMAQALAENLGSATPVADIARIQNLLADIAPRGNADLDELILLRDAAVEWVLANPDPLPLGELDYRR